MAPAKPKRPPVKRSSAKAKSPKSVKAKAPTARKPAKASVARKKPPAAPARAPKDRRAPETLRLRSIAPSFTVDDLDLSVAFYTGALGFFVNERWTDKNGHVTGVMLKAGGCELGLSQDDWGKGRDRLKGVAMRLWCETIQDIDALAARLTSLGFPFTEAPGDRPWGVRSFSVADPDGFQITIFRETGPG